MKLFEIDGRLRKLLKKLDSIHYRYILSSRPGKQILKELIIEMIKSIEEDDRRDLHSKIQELQTSMDNDLLDLIKHAGENNE